MNKNSNVNKLESSMDAVGAEMDFLPLTRPQICDEDIAAVVEVFKSGWITSGAKVAELESAICELTGCQHAVAVCSATAGMHLMLHALDIGPGDEVITPSLTWVSTINLIVLRGATPVFVDVDRDSLMTTAGLVRQAITPRTRLIIPVHYAGASLDLEPLRQVAAEAGVFLLEDAAHALGTTYYGQPIGGIGAAIFSFQATKNVTTAEGGMICVDDAELAVRLRRLRFHGLGVDAFGRETHGRLPQAEVLEPGYKYNLPDMNACLALGQLGRLQDINGRRAAFAERYLDRLSKIDFVMPLKQPTYQSRHAWHLFIVRIDTDRLGLSQPQFIAALKHRGIGSGIHFKAVHTHQYYRNSVVNQHLNLDATNWNSERIVSLPLFPDMTDDDVDRVVSAIEGIAEENHS